MKVLTLKEMLEQEFKIDPGISRDLVVMHTEEQIIRNLRYVRSAEKKGVVKDLASYAVNAIKQDYERTH